MKKTRVPPELTKTKARLSQALIIRRKQNPSANKVLNVPAAPILDISLSMPFSNARPSWKALFTRRHGNELLVWNIFAVRANS